MNVLLWDRAPIALAACLELLFIEFNLLALPIRLQIEECMQECAG